MIEFDEYVPLSFRTSEGPLGCGYLQFGTSSTTLVELAVEPYWQVLREVTITLFDRLSPWPSFSVSTALEGLPALATNFEDYKVLELGQDFNVSVRQGEIVVFWGELGPCEAYAFDRARFLAKDGFLVGVWFVDLTEWETTRFRSHVRPAGGQSAAGAPSQP